MMELTRESDSGTQINYFDIELKATEISSYILIWALTFGIELSLTGEQ
jgi:hypothetical protein